MRTFILLFAFLSLCVSNAKSQTLSLEEYCLKVADYSNTLKQSRQTLEYAESNLGLYKTDRLPSLAFSASADYVIDHPTQNSAIKNFNYLSTLTLSQTIYSGGAVRANIKSAQIETKIAQEEIESSEIEVLYSAQLTYWALCAAEEQLNIAENYFSLVDSLYRIVELRFNDGYIARTDLLMVETQLNQAKFSRAEAYKYYVEALISLNTLMGSSVEQTYTLSSSMQKIEPLSSILHRDYDLEQHPYYRVAFLTSKKSVQAIKLARSAYNPTFSLGVKGEMGTLAPNFNMDTYAWTYAYASLSVPIFDWNSRRHSVSMAKVQSNISNLNLQQVQDNLTNYYNTALTDVIRNFEQIEISRKSLLVAEENLDLQTFSYAEGKLAIIYILQAQISWLQAYNDFLTSVYSYQTSLSRYKLYSAR